MTPRLRISLSRAGPARAALVACLALLAGCGADTARTFGLTRDPPDEFQVSSRAPLTVPPDFNLRPPQPGQPRPQEGPARDRAAAMLAGRQGVVAGTAGPAAAGSSPGEAALLAVAREHFGNLPHRRPLVIPGQEPQRI